MCARYTQTRALAELARRFRVLMPDQPALDLPPRYNVAPSQAAAVVYAPEGRPELGLLRWGLIPAWAKDASIGRKTINARAESLADKPAFRDAYARRRCLVPADGWYEWDRGEDSGQPTRVTRPSGELFAMAGLWEEWRDAAGRAVRSFTVVTVAAGPDVAGLHERMPAVLRPEDEALWLSGDARPRALAGVLAPAPAGSLSLAPASARVGSPANEGPELLVPEPRTPRFL